MDYLKLFQTHEEYEEFVSGGTMVKPNVSHCVSENEVHYNPWTDPRLIVKYNVTDASNPTQLYAYFSEDGIIGAAMFDKVEIDGVEVSVSDLDASGGTHQFSTSGEHTVKYTLKDPTFIGIDGDPSDPSSVKFGATFINCYDIVSVEIPNSVISIGGEIFNRCSNLISVIIPDSVTSIGYSAFHNCTNLTSIVIPDSVTEIGEYAFERCSGLTSVTLSKNITTIANGVFSNCRSLTSIKIPNGVTSIGMDAFGSCSSLTSVTLNNGLREIGSGAFYNCSGLTSITIPNSVTTIGGSAFEGCI